MSGSGRTVVIGIGNADRRDDAAGLEVVHRLRGRLPEHMELLEGSGEAAALIEAWEGADCAVIIDATSSGAAPGRISEFHVGNESLPANTLRRSTHDFGLPEAIELSRRLGSLPPCVVVYGIEGQDFQAGHNLSRPVVFAIERLAREIRDRVAAAAVAAASG